MTDYSDERNVVIDRAAYKQAMTLILKLCQDDRELRHAGLHKAQALLSRGERTEPTDPASHGEADYLRMPWPWNEPLTPEQLAAQKRAEATYPHDPTIRALAAALAALELARANVYSDLAADLLDQALQHVRKATRHTNAAITAEADHERSAGADDETD